MTDASPSPGAPAEDPLSADRRTLAVAAVAMVAFVLIGVVSASIVTRSACAGLAPDPVTTTTSAGNDEAAAAALPEAGQQAVDALLAGRDLLGEPLGTLAVPGAAQLTALGDRVVAVGDTTSAWEPGADHPTAAVEIEGTVVGSGDGLFALAITNDLTGQTDALLPLHAGLRGGDCLDTATVGTPFAFHLDAGDGELALFRVEEDGDEPQLELRDAARVRWTADLDLGAGSPGVLAERLDAALGGDLAVTGRRAHPDEDAPVVQAFERGSGDLRWQLHLDDLAGLAPADAEVVRAEVLGVDDDLALLALSREDEEVATVIAVEAHDGTLRWAAELGGLVEPAGATLADDVLLAGRSAGTANVWQIDREDGSVAIVYAGAADEQITSLAADVGQVLVGRASGMDLLSGDPTVDDQRLDLPWSVRDLLVTDRHLVVLLGNGDDAVAVSFRR